MPLPDEEAPELKELERALEWLDEALYLGKKVLIHCRHGIGRTGTVLNAYLLRRGLGHKLAGRRLRKIRSKPANFDQWWAIRKYGRRSGRLTVREPSLEMNNLVDLGPFFADYEALAEQVEVEVRAAGPDHGGCGETHTRCCATPVKVCLVEAVYLAHHINTATTSDERMRLIEDAVQVARAEREQERSLDGGGEYCLAGAGTTCPLLQEGTCRFFDYRPLQCRAHGLPGERADTLWKALSPALDKISGDLFFAFTSSFPEGVLPVFGLPDVVSGRYVQTCFHYMLKHAG